MDDHSEESGDQTIGSLKKGKKRTTKPSPSQLGPATLLKVKEEVTEGQITEHEKREKALHDAKTIAKAIASGRGIRP